MNENTIQKFFLTAIDRTKSKNIRWSRLSRHTQIDDNVDFKNSFETSFGAGKIILLKKKTSNELICLISPDHQFGYVQLGEGDNPDMIRLYHVVERYVPSVESFVDAFIQNLDCDPRYFNPDRDCD